jgi:transcriptional regulator GlxA family with amidase domain
MDRHIEGTVSIEKLASSVGLSRRHLERLFLTETKSTLAMVYRRVRLEKARQIILKSKSPLTEIAIEVGFENASHFSRAFRQTFGQTPTQLRASCRSDIGRSNGRRL